MTPNMRHKNASREFFGMTKTAKQETMNQTSQIAFGEIL